MMMYATKIMMKLGCGKSYNALEIDKIYIEGAQTDGYYTKAEVHDFLKKTPGSIKVNLGFHPDLIPAVGPKPNYEKYVRSEPNDTPFDNLLKLPRV